MRDFNYDSVFGFFDAEQYHQDYLFKGGQSREKGDASTIRCYG